ncbi:RND family efflux transporter, MFP subunit [Lutimaribacter pacificus]|uniref:RND family efflux transporter, MFP subunit n=1 Tax=Lutimaribacter pacificus TaxID=391948 RepID=A0A1H0D2G5_9RHOB|nr:efflux RND transporter periplasmic adaptor subunit [Lutimaribacter pacificus]SDN64347.1 RND family efflux transporter, MFP subunit [Lutimaribacter pacificus]SHJ37697.1 RND family efflux transporter, MFP subunit [Lutimaribacter pacificus]
MRRIPVILLLSLLAAPLGAETLTISPVTLTEWKAIYGQVDTRDRVPARARIGGTVDTLSITEGDRVEAGQPLAVITDDKLQFQIDALNSRLDALNSQLATARADMERGRQLLDRGVITTQRFDALQTQVDVLEGEIAGTRSEKLVVERQIEEGRVLAPEAGIVLDVPVSRGSVITPGEAVAEIGGGGVFMRIAVPERFSAALSEGDTIQIEAGDGLREGRLAKLYPLITGGRLQADIEVEGLDARFIGRRVPVRLPVGERQALLVPQSAVSQTGGLDFVMIEDNGAALRHVVVLGQDIMRDGTLWREVLSGLAPGDIVVTGNE